jgi:hypothetical protein
MDRLYKEEKEMTKKVEYVVMATVDNSHRAVVTVPMSKEKATKSMNNLKKDMKIAIPTYQWAKNIRLKKVYHRNI